VSVALPAIPNQEITENIPVATAMSIHLPGLPGSMKKKEY